MDMPSKIEVNLVQPQPIRPTGLSAVASGMVRWLRYGQCAVMSLLFIAVSLAGLYYFPAAVKTVQSFEKDGKFDVGAMAKTFNQFPDQKRNGSTSRGATVRDYSAEPVIDLDMQGMMWAKNNEGDTVIQGEWVGEWTQQHDENTWLVRLLPNHRYEKKIISEDEEEEQKFQLVGKWQATDRGVQFDSQDIAVNHTVLLIGKDADGRQVLTMKVQYEAQRKKGKNKSYVGQWTRNK